MFYCSIFVTLNGFLTLNKREQGDEAEFASNVFSGRQ